MVGEGEKGVGVEGEGVVGKAGAEVRPIANIKMTVTDLLLYFSHNPVLQLTLLLS